MVDKEHVITLFKDFSEKEIDCLTEIMQPKSVSAGESIYEQGDPGGTLYGIVEGKVSIYSLKGMKGMRSQKDVIKTLSKGDFFGVLSFFDLKKHSAYSMAEQDSFLLFLEKEHFNHVVEKNYRIGAKVINKLSIVLSSSVRQMDKSLEGMLKYYFG